MKSALSYDFPSAGRAQWGSPDRMRISSSASGSDTGSPSSSSATVISQHRNSAQQQQLRSSVYTQPVSHYGPIVPTAAGVPPAADAEIPTDHQAWTKSAVRKCTQQWYHHHVQLSDGTMRAVALLHMSRTTRSTTHFPDICTSQDYPRDCTLTIISV